MGTVPGILGLVCPSFRPKSGSKSKIPGRVLKTDMDEEAGDEEVEKGSKNFNKHMEVMTKATLQTMQAIRMMTSILYLVFLVDPAIEIVKAAK